MSNILGSTIKEIFKTDGLDFCTELFEFKLKNGGISSFGNYESDPGEFSCKSRLDYDNANGMNETD